jgi:hypothetical protein
MIVSIPAFLILAYAQLVWWESKQETDTEREREREREREVVVRACVRARVCVFVYFLSKNWHRCDL